MFSGVQAADLPAKDLIDLSLEQLSSIVVTSVSREDERLSDAAASIFVISGKDIHRSGARTLPEALRLAPNLQVAQVDARNFAISARGFNSPFENKLLVLIDGRSVYSPLFSGVYWDAQDVVMEDIERIEVISGPGATIWGSNAVNGVINIITRPAKDTQGLLADASAGAQAKNTSLRYGGALSNGGHYRVYGKYADHDDTFSAAGANTSTGWRRSQTGFRTDWNAGGRNVTMQGDAYQGFLGQRGTADIRIAGANLLGRYSMALAQDSDVRLQAYLDHTERNQPLAFAERLDTLDLEAQHAVRLNDRHRFIWGAGYRYSWDQVQAQTGAGFVFLPSTMNMHWGNIFAQDELALRDDLRLTLGMKLEHNNYTGFESLPTLRVAWKPNETQLVWSALSRTVRSPSRIDRDIFVPANPPIVNGAPKYVIGGGPDFASETANVLEIGYRAQPSAALSFSATAFYSKYDNLRTLESQAGSASVFRNLGEGNARGIETWASWNASRAWRLSGGLVAQRIDTELKPGSLDTSSATGLATNDPSQYWMLRSSYDISEQLEFDATLRHVGALPKPLVPSYYEMDMRLGWKPQRNLELAIIGQNLLHSSHPEFGTDPARSLIERSVMLQAVLHY